MESGRMGRYTCARCNKSFELESTQKRHGYYCRSKHAGPRTSRKRSCISCTKAKTRCDAKQPHCSTCIVRNVSCQYSEFVVRKWDRDQSGTRVRTRDDAVTSDTSTPVNGEQSSITLSFEQDHDADGIVTTAETSSYGIQLARKEFPGLPDLETVSCAFDWDLEGHAGFTPSPSLEGSLSFPTISLSLEEPALFPQSPYPAIVKSAFLRRGNSLTPRSFAKPGAQMSALFVITIIGSYPAMMLRKETFPPFIHPLCVSGLEDKGDFIPEALLNCMSIAQMFANRSTGTSKFIWRMIRIEQQRIYSDYHTFDKWELLASGQALSIYNLMRMIEGPTNDNDFDKPLLLSLNMVSSTLAQIIDGEGSKQWPRVDQREWHEWIFHESRRRVVTVARILNMLIDIDHAANFVPLAGFALFPLPAKKIVWEARNASTWRAEFSETLKDRELFGLSTEGYLTGIRQEHDGGINTTISDWGKWYAEMDSFGTLTMIASSLL